MRILFDQGVPHPLRRFLRPHEVVLARDMAWGRLTNGALLAAAEREFDVIVTTDKNLKYQQNLATRVIAIVVLPTTNWRDLSRITNHVLQAVDAITPGAYVEVPLDARA